MAPLHAELSVMSLNVWWDSGSSLDRVCDVIRRSAPDLVALQECSLQSAEAVAAACGMFCAGSAGRREPVLSRWPVEPLGPQFAAGRGFRVRADLVEGMPPEEILWYNVHLRAYPYAPYVLHGAHAVAADPFEDPFCELLSSAQDDDNLEEDTFAEPPGTPSTPTSIGSETAAFDADAFLAATETERSAQLPGLREVLDDLQAVRHSGGSGERGGGRGGSGASEAGVVLLTGDFNAASHLDYPLGPAWPCSRLCAARGLLDSFHEARRQGAAEGQPAHTWAAKASEEPRGIHDRIDFVYFAGGLDVKKSMHLDGSNSGVEEWPSDHRAVLTHFTWQPVVGASAAIA